MAIPRNFVPADWTENAHPRKYDPAVISTFTVSITKQRNMPKESYNVLLFSNFQFDQ